MLNNLNILLGVSGGIAAYKAVDLASKLTAGGAKVKTVMTEKAIVKPVMMNAQPVRSFLTNHPESKMAMPATSGASPGLAPSRVNMSVAK